MSWVHLFGKFHSFMLDTIVKLYLQSVARIQLELGIVHLEQGVRKVQKVIQKQHRNLT